MRERRDGRDVRFLLVSRFSHVPLRKIQGETDVKRTTSVKKDSATKGATKAKPAGKRRSPALKPIELPEGTWERIARKAYELYEGRGRGEGLALQDWLKAEEIVMAEI